MKGIVLQRSLDHNAGERSAVVNSWRPSLHQYSKSSTAHANSGDVSTVRRRGPDPLVPLAHARLMDLLAHSVEER
jgi:hypothetical protein